MTPDAKPTVLVIDDETGILESLRILLKNEGFTPIIANSGKQALEQLADLRPDIVLSDVRMPNVGGVQVLSAARALDPEIPVILMTAQATLQSAMQAVNEGAFYYIQKPFRNDEMLAILRRTPEATGREPLAPPGDYEARAVREWAAGGDEQVLARRGPSRGDRGAHRVHDPAPGRVGDG